ncbi:MAG: sugar phosphate isomerase/epimerase [Clostridia bacterium]|nr:sugar phosphate isomerase/epimerase [Clostridia bacterium]
MILGATLGSLYASDMPSALNTLHELGVQSVELGVGGYVDTRLTSPKTLARSGNAVRQLKNLLEEYAIQVSALSCPGNPVHPDRAIAAQHHQDFVDACHIAQALGVDTVVVFSGCPGDCASSKAPNFVSTCWPADYKAVLDWQWERVLIPYWREAAAIAASYGIRRIAMKMMPGFCVYNPETLLRLRDEIGSAVGATVDPAHLIRQGIDPAAAIRSLKGAVFQVHAKDLLLDSDRRAQNGVFVSNPDAPPFHVRAVGNGHDAGYWTGIVKALRDIGYDRSVTVEYEDEHVPAADGFSLAVAAVRKLL